MQTSQSEKTVSPPSNWKVRWIGWRNRLFAKPSFQAWASRTPLVRRIARKKAQRVFDLVAGFTYTQTLYAAEQSGLLDLLAEGPCDLHQFSAKAGLSEAAADRLVRAAAGIEIAEEAAPGVWMLGELGASLVSNKGARAMVRHHHLLYADLADPMAMLRDDRRSPTALSEFWRYASNAGASGENAAAVNPYSELMAASQAMVCEQVLASYGFPDSRRVLDVGGGLGVFAKSLAAAHPRLEVGIFDLPGVLENTAKAIAEHSTERGISLHSGDFFQTPLPTGFDTVTLVRILHDHDDEPALALLHAIRAALPDGGQLVIAEPMAGVKGSEAMGETYFGLYLWAMRSGRPRNSQEIDAMLRQAGFQSIRRVATSQPMITSLTVATA